MKTWRMAFRNGKGGEELWPQCKKHGLAVIAYPDMDFDLSERTPEADPKMWAKLYSPQKYSLKAFAYDVKEKHQVYVKEGPKIVGHGVVTGTYRYDSGCPVKDTDGGLWPHVLDVEWCPFSPVTLTVGDQQMYTVRPLSAKDLQKIKSASRRGAEQERERTALEGQIEKRQQQFRKRNRKLIEVRKRESDYRCQVCHLRFDALYGKIGREFIIAHHVELLAGKSRPSRTTLADIALLCPNCHAMVHKRVPPFRLTELRRMLRWEWDYTNDVWRSRTARK